MIHIGKYIAAGFAGLMLMGLASCSGFIFDDEGDCEVTHTMRFRYEKNLKWADAFPSEVKAVNLYAFDSDGVFVKEFSGAGEALADPSYGIRLDLPAGDYRFVAWCGLVDGESFTVPQPRAGVTTIEDLTCSLNTIRTAALVEDGGYSDRKLDFLYHGYLEASITDDVSVLDREYTMYLTKDTNHIRIIVQELSGEGLEADDYDIMIQDDNGEMAYDNELRPGGVVTYRPWFQDTDELGVGKDAAEGGLQYINGLYADLTVARMMASHEDDMMLTITRRDSKEIVARIPILQYALLSKRYYEDAYGHAMPDDQEFLDREDEYVMTFFLVNHKLVDGLVMVHSWRIVRHDYDVGAE